MEVKSQERGGWATYAVIVWCVVFGGIHFYWALGGDVGLALFSIPSNQNLVATRAPGYIGLTWAVGFVCLYGAIIALATLQAWGRYIPRWIVLITLWIACALCVVRGLGNPIQDLAVLAGVLHFEALDGPEAIAWYRWMLLDAVAFSPWFTLGGIAFGVTAWSARQHGRDLAERKVVRYA